MRSFNLIATSLTLVMGGAALAPNANASISLNFHTNKHTITSDGDSNIYIKGPGVNDYSIPSKQIRDIARQHNWKFNEKEANHYVGQWKENRASDGSWKPSGDTKALGKDDYFYRDFVQSLYQRKAASNKRQQQQSRPAPQQASTPAKSTTYASERNSVHEKCKDARDYQGCISAFTGKTTSSRSSDFEERQLRIQQQMLDEQKRAAWATQEREEQRAKQERRRRLGAAIQKGFNDMGEAFKMPTTTNCTSNAIGSTVYTNCY